MAVTFEDVYCLCWAMRYILILLFTATCLHAQRTVGLITFDTAASSKGYTLFAPVIDGAPTYLIDNHGQVVHSWQSDLPPGLAVMLLEDGTLLRTEAPSAQAMGGGGAGGIVKKISWDGVVTWHYEHYGPTYRAHHDVEILPNGNVLLLVWESHSVAEALAAGRLPERLVDNSLWSERVIEVKPTGPTTGEVVWSWNTWDNLVQDINPEMANYGVVKEHPERININCGGNRADWLHANSVRYNPIRDEVLISFDNINEFVIVSRASGKIVYRWGNPKNYASGLDEQQRLWGQHDVRWVPGNWNSVTLFHNGLGRPNGFASSVEMIELPVNSDGTYRKNRDQPFEPTESAILCPENLSIDFFAQNISGATVLPNGNILTCIGPSGVFVEFAPDKREVWRYVNPVSMTGIVQQGTEPRFNMVFKINRYPLDYPAFAGKALAPQGCIEESPLSVHDQPLKQGWLVFIDPANNRAVVDVTTEGHYTITAYDVLGCRLDVVVDAFLAVGRHVLSIPQGTIALVRE